MTKSDFYQIISPRSHWFLGSCFQYQRRSEALRRLCGVFRVSPVPPNRYCSSHESEPWSNKIFQRSSLSRQTIYVYTVKPLQSTDHGPDFKWTVQGGGRFRELKYVFMMFYDDCTITSDLPNVHIRVSMGQSISGQCDASIRDCISPLHVDKVFTHVTTQVNGNPI